MRVTPALLITLACSIWGTLRSHPHLWLPYSGFIASLVELRTRAWVAGDRLGEWTNASVALKFFFALIGFYALLTMPACLLLAIYWLIR